MSRFQNRANNHLFKKKQSINKISIEEIIEPEPEPIMESESIQEVSLVIEAVIQEPVTTEPIILLEEIYSEPDTKEEVKLEENPIQTELKKRKSRELFQVLVQEVILNKKKENIKGWNV